MPTADEMLAGAVEEQYILVDLNTRLLNIPKSITNIGVESDDDVLRLPFKMPRYLGKFDLSEFKVRVNYLNAKKLGDLFEPDDITVTEDGYITFTWLVGRYAAAYKGNVSFNVCLKKYDVDDPTLVVKEFNTTIAILPVLEGLETAEAVVAAYADVLEAWKTELFNIYEDIENAVDEYIASLGVSSVMSINGRTGAVNLTHEDVGAAPAGLVTELINVANEAELETALSERFASMKNRTVRYLYIGPSTQDVLGGRGSLCELSCWTTSSGGYGTARFITYGNSDVTIAYKSLYGGVWSPLEDGSPRVFAPAGYGLGVKAKEILDANTAVTNGWYKLTSVNANDAHIPFQYVAIHVTAYSDRYIVQDLYRTNGQNAHMRREMYDDTWGEWEYVNPPMLDGVEYRTTERIDGKAVYKKNVDGVTQYRLDGETTWQPFAKAVGGATVITGWCELKHDGWSGSAPYTQTVSAPGVLASDTPIVDVKIWDGDDSATILSHMDGWSCIDNVVAGNGTMTAYCYEEKPSVWVSFKYIVVR